MGNRSTCKHCGQTIEWAAFEFAPSVWFHEESGQARCYPIAHVATPDE